MDPIPFEYGDLGRELQYGLRVLRDCFVDKETKLEDVTVVIELLWCVMSRRYYSYVGG